MLQLSSWDDARFVGITQEKTEKPEMELAPALVEAGTESGAYTFRYVQDHQVWVWPS